MKAYACDKIRNVGLAGHAHSGKTQLTEAMLFLTGMVDRLGSPDAGSTASDHDPEEIKRKISILSGVVPVPHGDCKINVIDTPGTSDFLGEIRTGLRITGGIIACVDATAGVAAGTELAADLAEEFGLPLCFVITKMDKEHADFSKAVQSIKDDLGLNAVPVVLPLGQEKGFKGVIDLVEKDVITYDDKGKGTKGPIPDDLKSVYEEGESALQEAAAEGKDDLIEKFFADAELTDAEVREGLHVGFLERRVFPVLCCSGTTLVGVERLMDFINHVFPMPNEKRDAPATKGGEEVTVARDAKGPALAYVFKTESDPFTGRVSFFKVISGKVKKDAHLYNVRTGKEERLGTCFAVIGKKHVDLPELEAGDIGAAAKLTEVQTGDTLADSKDSPSIVPTPLPEPTTRLALKASDKGDEEKIGVHLHKLTDADPTLEFVRQPHLGQTVIAGMGDTHLEVAVSRLSDAAKIKLSLDRPRVDYRETITKTASGQYRHKKQTGGAGQFGEVHIRLEPLNSGEEFEFDWEVVGGNVPTKFQGACEKGFREGMKNGILAGCQATGIKAVVYDGKYHPVDSKDIAFQIASLQAFKQVSKEAGPVLLEPICELEITIPDSSMGDVMGDITSKRGHVLGSDSKGHRMMIKAEIPQAEIFTYSRDLRSITSGRGTFTSKVVRYERVPPDVQQKAIAEYEASRNEG